MCTPNSTHNNLIKEKINDEYNFQKYQWRNNNEHTKKQALFCY